MVSGGAAEYLASVLRWWEGAWLVLEELIAGWDGEHTVIRFDRPAGTWVFVCVHSKRPGSCTRRTM